MRTCRPRSALAASAPASFIHSPSAAPAVSVYLEEEWWRHDIHAQRALELNVRGFDVFDDYTVATPEEIETLPIYVDFFRRVGFGWLMSCAMLPEADSLVALTLTRAKSKGAYTADEKRTLGLIGRHVEQALRISIRLERNDDTETMLLSALDKIDVGVYALTGSGLIRFANQAGETRFADHFDRVDGRMVPKVEADRVAFQALLAASSQMRDAGATFGERAPRSCVVGGIEGRGLAAWAIPLTGASQWRFNSDDPPETLVLTTPIERNQTVDPVLIRDIFDVTLGEARLASLIGGGMTVREAAGKLGVTEGTARNVLKQVFRKLGVNRQSEVVHKVSNIAVFVPAHDRRRF